MNNKLFSRGIFIDLKKKAFDTVNNNCTLILNKLERYGI